MTNFARNLAQGDRFSLQLRDWFHDDGGFYPLPLDLNPPAGEYRGPAALGGWYSVLPDLLICKDGVTLAVEAKWKTETTWTRATGTEDIGIDHLKDYRRFAADSGIPTYVLVRVRTQNLFLLANVDDLRERPALNPSSPTSFVPVNQDTWHSTPPTALAHLNRVVATRANRKRRNRRTA